MSKGKVVCIYGAKGGVGNTTYALSLAGIVSNQNKKVLIIDLDLSNGAVACALNRMGSKTIYNFCDDYLNNRYKEMEDYITRYNENIDFIAAPKDPRQTSKIDAKYIEILIDKCKFMYDLVLIDTNNILNEMNVFMFDKCDYLHLLTTNDPIALKNLKNLVNILDDNEIDKYKLILNNSIFPNKNYFSMYDIKNILNHNVDYVISKYFHVNEIDSLTLNGEIITLKYKEFKDLKVFNVIIKDILGGDVK